jgi:hypothetical protein
MGGTWSYRDSSWAEGEDDLVGYDVEATDGSIGRIDRSTYETGAGYIVVDTGFWIFGEKRLIPAGALNGVNRPNKKVMVSMTRDQIKSAPDYDEALTAWDEESRSRHSDYFDPYFR